MPKPQPRQPRTELPSAPPLTPAPDNGVDYVDRGQPESTPASRGRSKEATIPVRKYPQLGVRVPPALFERVQRCCTETGVSQAFLVQRAIEHELEQRGF
ncbi:MAG: hypothetical protein ACJ71Y_01235 [Blastococcus sp.]